jgi:glucose/arabinose dehydrogenase
VPLAPGDGDIPQGRWPRCGKIRAICRGWNDNGYYLGRPVDVAQLPDGSLLVSDDLVGALYRIWYDGK